MFANRRLLGAAVPMAAAALYVHQNASQPEEVPFVPKTICTESFAQKEKRVQILLERFLAISGAPGASVGVAVNGKQIFANGYGFCDVENSTPCSADTVMRIASISKAITSVLTARLCEQGKLQLDSSIYKILVNYPKKTYNGKDVDITIRQLLSHKGGIRHYPTHMKDATPEEVDKNYAEYGKEDKRNEFLSRKVYKTTDAALELFKNDDLAAEPGTYLYTTHGFTVLAACLEKASGKKYPELVRSFFRQMGMTNSYLDENDKIIPLRSKFYRRNAKHQLVNVPEVDNSYKYAGGGLLSNVGDLLIFGNAVLFSFQTDDPTANSLLCSTTVRQLWDINNLNEKYGLGWQKWPQEPLNGGTQRNRSGIWYHTGAGVGASSVLMIKPQPNAESKPNGICVAVLVNCQELYPGLTSLAAEIAEIFVDY